MASISGISRYSSSNIGNRLMLYNRISKLKPLMVANKNRIAGQGATVSNKLLNLKTTKLLKHKTEYYNLKDIFFSTQSILNRPFGIRLPDDAKTINLIAMQTENKLSSNIIPVKNKSQFLVVASDYNTVKPKCGTSSTTNKSSGSTCPPCPPCPASQPKKNPCQSSNPCGSRASETSKNCEVKPKWCQSNSSPTKTRSCRKHTETCPTRMNPHKKQSTCQTRSKSTPPCKDPFKKHNPCKSRQKSCPPRMIPCKKLIQNLCKPQPKQCPPYMYQSKKSPCQLQQNPCAPNKDPCKKQKPSPCKPKCPPKSDPCQPKKDPCAPRNDPCKKQKPSPCKPKSDPCQPEPRAPRNDPCKKQNPSPCKPKCPTKSDPCQPKKNPCSPCK